jgi:hypothetical protein
MWKTTDSRRNQRTADGLSFGSGVTGASRRKESIGENGEGANGCRDIDDLTRTAHDPHT